MRHIIAAGLAMVWIFMNSGSVFSSSPAESNIEYRLQQMSLQQKVGQVMIGSFTGPGLSPELEHKIRDLHLGGVILYKVTGNTDNAAQIACLTDSVQQTAREAGEVPLFIAIDQEGGRVTRITEGVTRFPGNMALGATDSDELAAKAAMVMATELRLLGINMNYAPVLDVNSNPRNPIIGTRSFGSSPETVARMGLAVIDSYNAAGVIATAKHFPGHGDTSVDSHLGLPVVNRSLEQLSSVELAPFRAVIKEVPAIMTAHIVMPAIDGHQPATLSPAALSLLRHDMGFQGLIITDSMSMKAIATHWSKEEAAIRAFLAGADILLYGADLDSQSRDQDTVYAALVDAVTSGRISLARLDDSVRRILSMKSRFGILDHQQAASHAELASPAHTAVAEEIARDSLTLVRDSQALLPLSGQQKIPILWPAEMKGELQPLLEEMPYLIPHYLPLSVPAKDSRQVKQLASQAPVILIGTYNLAGQPAWKQLVNSLEALRTVVLAVRSPYDLMFIPNRMAFVASYDDNPVTLKMLGRLLKGDIVPRGRLPVTIPEDDKQP